MAQQTYTNIFGFPNNFQNKEASADTPILAADLNVTANTLEKQLQAPFKVLGSGVSPNYAGQLAVTMGGGLGVNVAKGVAVVGYKTGLIPVENPASYPLSPLFANRGDSNPIYLFVLAGDGTNGAPLSAQNGLAIFRQNDTPTLAGAVLLAKITTSGSAVLSVVDMRQFINLGSDSTPGTGGDPATTTALGTVKMSVAPADPANPIAVGTNHGVGGVLSGNILNPGFAVDMATQAELDAGLAGKANSSHTHAVSDIVNFTTEVQNAMESVSGAPVQSLADLRAVAPARRQDKQERFVEDVTAIYAFNLEGTGTDDGDGIIAPTTGSGRWFKIAAGSTTNAATLQGQNGAYYRNRANHTGTQDASTITGLGTVATSNSYPDLINKPTLSAAQQNQVITINFTGNGAAQFKGPAGTAAITPGTDNAAAIKTKVATALGVSESILTLNITTNTAAVAGTVNSYIVSNDAGVVATRGEYTDNNAPQNGGRVCVNGNNANIRLGYNGTNQVIWNVMSSSSPSSNSGSYYYSPACAATVVPLTGWSVGPSNGTAPAPTLAQGATTGGSPGVLAMTVTIAGGANYVLTAITNGASTGYSTLGQQSGAWASQPSLDELRQLVLSGIGTPPTILTASATLTTSQINVSCDFVNASQVITLADCATIGPLLRGSYLPKFLTIANVGTVAGSVALGGTDKFGGNISTAIPLNPGDTLRLDPRQRSAANSNAWVYQVM